MLSSSQTDKLARFAIDHSLRLQHRDTLRIRGELSALPLIKAAFRIACERGAYPFVDITFSELDQARLTHTPFSSLDYTSPIEKEKIERIDADLWIISEPEPLYTGIPRKRLLHWQQAQEILHTRWAQRTGDTEKRLRWCAVLYPSPEFARIAHISQEEFANLVAHAMFLDGDDPIQACHTLAERQQEIIKYLADRDTLRIVAPGTDLTVCIRERGWYNAAGQLNLPDGEVCTSPWENKTHGKVKVSFPVRYQGAVIEGIEITFTEGKVTGATATQGNEMLQDLLDTDAGSRRLGEFAIATNHGVTQFTNCILMDEKMGGTCHFALGRSLPGTGGTNESALHIDMIVDLRQEGEIFADGKLIFKNGSFVGPLEASRPPRWVFWKRQKPPTPGPFPH